MKNINKILLGVTAIYLMTFFYNLENSTIALSPKVVVEIPRENIIYKNDQTYISFQNELID